jgi:two-component system, LytTR family, sensor kinase
MKFKNTILTEQDKTVASSFWQKAFLVYALIEALYCIINNVTARIVCGDCGGSISFDISQWLIHLCFTALLWYFLYLLQRQRKWVIIAGNITVFVAYYFLWLIFAYWLLYFWGEWLLGLRRENLSFRRLVNGSWFEVGKYVLKLTAFYSIQFYFDYRNARQQRIQLAVINKDMQLDLLKQQLNPHFYFNTLNNLYGLARSNNSKLSPALHQLSNIMQYVLVDCNRPKVLLKQEILFLESYIALEKLRYEKDTVIEMNVKGETNGKTIIPLVLVQFVENAFKHGMKEKSSHNWIKVNFVIEENELQFTVNNSYEQSTAANGIGISSVKDILQLQYEGKHELLMQQQAGYFSVILKLSLV